MSDGYNLIQWTETFHGHHWDSYGCDNCWLCCVLNNIMSAMSQIIILFKFLVIYLDCKFSHTSTYMWLWLTISEMNRFSLYCCPSYNHEVVSHGVWSHTRVHFLLNLEQKECGHMSEISKSVLLQAGGLQCKSFFVILK